MSETSTRANGSIVTARALPGERHVDRDLVDEAVRELNRIYVSRGLETVRALGLYLAETFFGGDASGMASRASGHRSFRELGRRADLQVSHTFLWYAVRILPQLESLPGEVAMALPVSHHRLLVHVPGDEARAELAQRAVENRLGKRELQDEVRRLLPGRRAGGGRQPQPLVTAVRRLGRAVAEMEPIPASATAGARALEPAEVDELRATLAAVRSRCEELDRAIGVAEEHAGPGDLHVPTGPGEP